MDTNASLPSMPDVMIKVGKKNIHIRAYGVFMSGSIAEIITIGISIGNYHRY
jgi:hypothetical protein